MILLYLTFFELSIEIITEHASQNLKKKKKEKKEALKIYLNMMKSM